MAGRRIEAGMGRRNARISVSDESVAAGLISPAGFLMLMAVANGIATATWNTLLNNFVIERAHFTGQEIGILQSLREVPGLLAFTAVAWLLLLREQTFALMALMLLGLGVAATGFLPFAVGLYAVTVLMSFGFHYYETMNQSLSLQWLPKARAPALLGRIGAAGAAASIATFGVVFALSRWAGLDYVPLYVLGGGAALVVVAFLAAAFPRYEAEVRQHRHLFLRRRYWLYYVLTFLAGARRQIFVVFAGFLMVEKFHYSVSGIAALFAVNGLLNIWLMPKIGALVGRIGERRALILEYAGLIAVFVAYAMVENPWVAAGLYIADHALFSWAIALKTYFQKIADPRDIAPTAGVAFSINHVAAVVLPALLGLLWLKSPALVFLAGAGIAVCSLLLALLIPPRPGPGRETLVARLRPAGGASGAAPTAG